MRPTFPWTQDIDPFYPDMTAGINSNFLSEDEECLEYTEKGALAEKYD
jgi:hypothetical protein